MLYTAQSKLLPQPKNKVQVSNSSEMETFLNEFNNSMAKNLGSSFSKIIMQKYGRKIGRRESQQLNYKFSKSSNLINSIHRSSNQQQSLQNFHPNFTIYDGNRNKKMKRHTYNYRFSSSREQNKDNTVNNKDNSSKHKRSLITTQVAKTQETMKRICIQKIMFEDSKDADVDQPQFLQSKQHAKKFSIQNKLMPINYNPNIYEKPSLVDLINKYKFQNLKTNNLPLTPKKLIQQDLKASIFINPKFSPKKEGKFHKKTHINYHHKTFKKNQPKKQAKQTINDKKSLLKKMNSLLSPWGTIGDEHSFIQSPAA